MKLRFTLLNTPGMGLLLAAVAGASAPVLDAERAAELRERYRSIVKGWAVETVFTDPERKAMEEGRRWDNTVFSALDDPLAQRVLTRGEPSFDSMTAEYPGKILDRTVIGSYSDPRRAKRGSEDEFTVWWNGALSADLLRGHWKEGVQPVTAGTVIAFRAGAGGETLGRDRNRLRPFRYAEGYLPIVEGAYTLDGVEYAECLFTDAAETGSATGDLAWVGFRMTNVSGKAAEAVLGVELIRMDGATVRVEGTRAVDAAARVLAVFSTAPASFDARGGVAQFRRILQPGETAWLGLRVPYYPAAAGAVPEPSARDYDAAREKTAAFWRNLVASGARIHTPEALVNDVWRTLLVQNFILADGPVFMYGSGLWYNDSFYPFENAFAAHTLARYGHLHYAGALQHAFVPVAMYPQQAGRKYQNRRAMPLHHLWEHYRLSGSYETFERNRELFYRVADEIVRDHNSTRVEVNGEKPLHYGLLPSDSPAVDLRAATQRTYVIGHSITNAQGLQDFGDFLVKSGIDPERGKAYQLTAAQFRRDIFTAMRRAAIRKSGRPPFVDLQTLYFRETPEFGPEPYDDLANGRVQGTYFHYWVGMQLQYHFFDPEDDIAQWLTEYARTRNGFVLACVRARLREDQPYGWVNNVYNVGYYHFQLRAGALDRFLLGFYSRLAFGMTRNLYAASEGSPLVHYNTRLGGYLDPDISFPNSAANAETLQLLRAMLVDEELRANRATGIVDLAKGTPRAWLRHGREISIRNAATYFGEAGFSIRSQAGTGRIEAAVHSPRRGGCNLLRLHLRHPDGKLIRHVRVNGATHRRFDPAGVIELAPQPGTLRVEALY